MTDKKGSGDTPVGEGLKDLVERLSSQLEMDLGQYGSFMKQASEVFGELQEQVSQMAANEQALAELSDVELPEGMTQADLFNTAAILDEKDEDEDEDEDLDFSPASYTPEELAVLMGGNAETAQKIAELEKQGEILLEKVGAVDKVVSIIERNAAEIQRDKAKAKGAVQNDEDTRGEAAGKDGGDSNEG